MLTSILRFLAAIMFFAVTGTYLAYNGPRATQGMSAFGTLLQRGDGGGPEVFTSVAEINNLEIPGVETDIIETTHHTSPGAFKEYVLGLRDGGEVTVEGNYVPKAATQNASTGLLNDNLTGVKRNWKCLFPDGVAAIQAALNVPGVNANAGIRYVAVASGTGGNAITIAHVIAGNNTPLSVGVVGNAITVNVGTGGTGAATSTADQVIAAVLASGPASALVSASRMNNNDGTGIVSALAATNLAGGVAAVAGTVWAFTAYVRNFRALAPHDGKLAFRATLKITGQPTLA